MAAQLKQPLLHRSGQARLSSDDGRLRGVEATRWHRHRNVTFRSYPKLNHLFVEGENKAKPAEYEKAGHVSRELIDDLAAWIKSQNN